jgi:hypothetical protein
MQDENQKKEKAYKDLVNDMRITRKTNIFGLSTIEENTRILGDLLLQYLHLPNIEVSKKIIRNHFSIVEGIRNII